MLCDVTFVMSCYNMYSYITYVISCYITCVMLYMLCYITNVMS